MCSRLPGFLLIDIVFAILLLTTFLLVIGYHQQILYQKYTQSLLELTITQQVASFIASAKAQHIPLCKLPVPHDHDNRTLWHIEQIPNPLSFDIGTTVLYRITITIHKGHAHENTLVFYSSVMPITS